MKNYDSITTMFKWIRVSTCRIPYMGFWYTLWEGVSWHLMGMRVGSIVRTREFVLIPKRYLSFSWWVSVCLYATVRVDGSRSVRMLRSVRTYTRDLLISESRAFLAIIFANYLTRYLGLCQVNFLDKWGKVEPNDVVVSWLRLQEVPNCIPHPYWRYMKCLSTFICCGWAHGCTLTL